MRVPGGIAPPYHRHHFERHTVGGLQGEHSEGTSAMTTTRRLRFLLLGVGAIGAAVAIFVSRSSFDDAAAHTWSPFVLVTGLLLIGVVANEDGVFAAAAGLLSRVPGGALVLYLAAMLLVAVVTVFLNLDTSVAFTTPVLIHVACRRGANELRFLYGCVFMSNAASLLLPGSNLTNLLILANEHTSGSVFLTRMVAPWVAAVLVTIVVVAVAFRRGDIHLEPTFSNPIRLRVLSMAGILTVAVLILVLADPALPVLAVGLALVTIRLAQRRLAVSRVQDVDVLSLLAIFLVALSLGSLERVWSFPGQVMATAGSL